MSEIEAFKDQVEEFLRRNRITPTRFGILFAQDPQFVFQLRAGREPRTRMRQRILEAMSKAQETV